MTFSRTIKENGIVKTACGLCPMSCGMEVHISSGKIVKIQGIRSHTLNKGFLCPKGRAVPEYVYSPHRLTTPLLRQGSSWQEISWEQAMNTIVAHLEELRSNDEAKSLAFALGMPVLLSGTFMAGVVRRFAHNFGTPNCISVESICYRCRMLGYISTLGKFFEADPENSACIIVWGTNPDQSSPPVGIQVKNGQRKGARLIVIDPCRTKLAAKAEHYLQPRPGTDGALILAMMNVINGEGLYDKEFVSKYTVGFNELAEHVKAYSPERVQEITSVEAEKIKEVARIFATHRPGCILQGTNSLDQTSSGFQNSRGVAILQAITGNIDIPGAFIQVPRLRVNIVEETKKVPEIPIGIKEYPVFYGIYGRTFGEGQTMILLESILSGQPYPVNSMIVSGSNPVLTWPNSNKVEKALSKLKFLVVMDQFMTKTARLAHLVLPAATFLERTELCDYYSLYGEPYVMVRKKVLEYGQCRSDLHFWLELAHRLGYQKEFPWSDAVSLLDYMLEPSGFTYETLTEQYPDGYCYGQKKYKTYEHQNFKTPSGKIELYSQGLSDLGYSPLPDYQEPPESKISTPELAKKYPLSLTTGARKVYHTHSQHRQIPSLSSKVPEPLAEINPVTAGQYGLKDMDIAIVESPRGEIEMKVNVTDAILPGVINIPHGWEEANVNVLTNNTPADQITGYPALKGLLCSVRKKGSQN